MSISIIAQIRIGWGILWEFFCENYNGVLERVRPLLLRVSVWGVLGLLGGVVNIIEVGS